MSHLQCFESKPTQPPALSGTTDKLRASDDGFARLIGAMMCLRAAPLVITSCIKNGDTVTGIVF